MGADAEKIRMLPPATKAHLLAAAHSPDYNPPISKLKCIVTLSDDECQAVANLPMQVTAIGENQDIVRVEG